jgi:hypothetical protein
MPLIPISSGYRLFTVDGSLGETAPEKLAYFIIDIISMSILRFVLPAAGTSSGKQLPATPAACACPMQNAFHITQNLEKEGRPKEFRFVAIKPKPSFSHSLFLFGCLWGTSKFPVDVNTPDISIPKR